MKRLKDLSVKTKTCRLGASRFVRKGGVRGALRAQGYIVEEPGD